MSGKKKFINRFLKLTYLQKACFFGYQRLLTKNKNVFIFNCLLVKTSVNN